MFEGSSDLAAYLAPGERIVWEGRGRRGPVLASVRGVIFLGVFGAIAMMMVLLLIIFTTIRSTQAIPPILVLVLPFIVLIIGISVGIPGLMLEGQAGRARYMVTSSAAMIVSENRWTGKRVAVISLKSAPQVSLTENRDGTGTLMFGQNLLMMNSRYSGGWWTDSIPAFWNIERPLEVYQLIRRQMGEA